MVKRSCSLSQGERLVKTFLRRNAILILAFGLMLLLGCALSPAKLLVEAGLITPTPTPDPFVHYRAILQPWASQDIEQVSPLPQYHITVRLDDASSMLRGVVKVTVPHPEPVLIFRLYPNLANYGGAMSVTDARIDDIPVSIVPLAEGTAVQLQRPVSPDVAAPETVIVDLAFEVNLNSGPGQDNSTYTLFGWDGPILSLPGFYPTLAVQQEGAWILDQPPEHGDVLFNEVALYQLDLILPKNLVVVASGITLNVIDNPDSSRTWQITGGPLRDMTVLAGPFEAVSENAAGAVVTSYYLAGHEAAGQAVLAHAAASLRLYSETYGKYPYTELDVIEAPLNVRGMEYSGLILIGEDLYQDQREYLTFLVAHEVGHQWWYSLVGSNPYQHPWLDEGLTEYSAFEYYRGVFGQPAAEQILVGRWQIPFTVAAEGGVDGRIDRPAQDFDPTSYELLVYAKSALFFNALRQELGEDLYFQVIRAHFEENRYQIVEPYILLDTAQRISGRDLGPLVEEWLQ